MKNFTLLFSALLLTAFGWQANAQWRLLFLAALHDYDT